MRIVFDTFNEATERIHSNLPNYPSISTYLSGNSVKTTPTTTFNPNKSGIFHRFYLPNENFYLSPSTIAPSLLIKRTNCSTGKKFLGMITLNTLWCHYFHYVAIENAETEITFQLPTSAAAFSNYSQEKSPSFIDLYLDPNCSYEMSVYYSLINWFSQLIRLHCTHICGLLYGHLILSLAILTFQWMNKFHESNSDHYSSSTSQDDRHHHHFSIIHEIYYHQIVTLINFIGFQLIPLPFSEWFNLQQTGQLGLRLINTLQSSSSSFTASFELILNHLPLLIISIPFGCIIPVVNRMFDQGFLLLSQLLIHYRCDYATAKQKKQSNQNNHNNFVSSSSLWLVNLSIMCILLIGWLFSESLAVSLLSLLLLFFNIISFHQHNHVNTVQLSIDNNNNHDQLLFNVQQQPQKIQTKSFTLNNNNNHHQMNYLLKLFYLIQCRLFVLLLMISLFMFNDWIALIERIRLLYDFSIFSLFSNYSIILQFHNHLISSTLLILCTSIWLLQFCGIVHIQSRSSSSPTSPTSSWTSLSLISSSLLLLCTFYNNNTNNNNEMNKNFNTTNHTTNNHHDNKSSINRFSFNKFLLISCKFIMIYLISNLFHLTISLYSIVQLTTFSIQCICFILCFTHVNFSFFMRKN
ncbi:unnamed protein product [Schistosoma turkestanicum]|nr:unnamed protein product [Schistosoma turkestanicum]